MLNFCTLSADDLPIISDLYYSVFTAPPWNDDWNDSSQLREYLRDLTDVRNALSFGMFDENKLIGATLGHVMHWCTGTQYYIHEFFIDSKRLNCGLGTIFLKHNENSLIELQIKDIFLHTGLHTPAYIFYKKNGFTLIEDHVSLIKHISE